MSAIPLTTGIVQPWDCDVMGHFTVRCYAAEFDDASYQLIFAITGEPPVSRGASFGWADVKQVYEYHSEMRPGDIYEITGHPVRLGTSSVTVEYRMQRRDSGALVASMTSSLVRFDLAARKAIPIEGQMRARVEKLLADSAA